MSEIPTESSGVNIPLCRSRDSYVFGRSYWQAYLNDGEVILQDDGRPGILEQSAWKRLKQYCLLYHKDITKLYLTFRSHTETPLPDNAKGYYFRRVALGMVGLQGNWRDGTSETLDFALLGYISREDDKLHVQLWKVPELQRAPFVEGHMDEIRPIDPDDESLILSKELRCKKNH